MRDQAKRRDTAIGRGAVILGSIYLLAAIATIAPASALAEDEILVLSSKHLGMTSEEIVESEKAPKVEASAPASEWRSDHGEAPAAACPPIVASQGTVRAFEDCVEAAIRAGNGYGESSRVCRSLFPEQTATVNPAGSEVSAPIESGTAIQ